MKWERINFNVRLGTVSKLKALAEEQGLPYQMYLRQLIEKKLSLASKRA